MVRFTVEEFDPGQWLSGISWFQTPARVGYHLVEALDAYFWRHAGGQEFTYGRRFDGTWWEMEDAQLPSQEALLEYLDEVQGRIEGTFMALEDADLSTLFDLYDWSGKTLAGHYAYALRHTMHHQGALSALATYHGHEGQNWA
jgi:uncharacterized damage-inducible protein DinB